MKPNPTANLIEFPGGFFAKNMRYWPAWVNFYSHTLRGLDDVRVGDTVLVVITDAFHPFSSRLVQCTALQSIDGYWWLVEDRLQPKPL